MSFERQNFHVLNTNINHNPNTPNINANYVTAQMDTFISIYNARAQSLTWKHTHGIVRTQARSIFRVKGSLPVAQWRSGQRAKVTTLEQRSELIIHSYILRYKIYSQVSMFDDLSKNADTRVHNTVLHSTQYYAVAVK